MSTLSTPSSLDEQVASITQGSALNAITRIKQIVSNKEGYGPDQVRLILETAQTYEVRAKPQRPAVRQALRNALKKLPQETGLIQSPKSSGAATVEVVTDAEVKSADLRSAAQRINEALETIRSHEGAMLEATLEHRLCIGLEIARAQESFGLTNAQAGAIGGEAKAASTKPFAVTSNPLGFSNWLAKEIPDLKRPTAIKYATAFAGTGLSIQDATPTKIREVVKKFRHDHGKASKPMPCLEDFYKLGRVPKSELTIIAAKPITSKQLRLEDARQFFHEWQEDFEKALKKGHLDHLDKKGLEDLQEFTATVRDRIKARLK